jgi:hypothetical protein
VTTLQAVFIVESYDFMKVAGKVAESTDPYLTVKECMVNLEHGGGGGG